MDEERRNLDAEIDAILAELSQMETSQPQPDTPAEPVAKPSQTTDQPRSQLPRKLQTVSAGEAAVPAEPAAAEDKGPSTEEGEISEKSHSWKQELWDWVRTFAIALAAAILVFGFLLRFVIVEGPSMEPTLKDGDRLVISGLFYKPDTGDIVILSDKTGLGIPLIKRIIAIGGQDLTITADGQVIVDGVPLSEPYAAELAKNPGEWDYPLAIPEGMVFVMGDNRNHSTDSRSSAVGLVDEKEILGRVLLRILPLGKFGPVK